LKQRALLLGFAPLAERHNLCWIDGLAVNLYLDNFAFLVDQIIDAPRRLVFWIVKPVLLGDVAAPIAQQREGDADFLRPRVIAEHAVHAYTQDLGVCSFQLCQVLLEVLHLFLSTTCKGENIKRQRDILLATEVVQGNFLTLGVPQCKVRGHVADLDRWFGHGVLFFLRRQPANGGWSTQSEHPEQQDGKSSSHSRFLLKGLAAT